MTHGHVVTGSRKQDLDGLRGVAVLLTIFLHYVARSGVLGQPGTGPLALLLDSTWSGVLLIVLVSPLLRCWVVGLSAWDFTGFRLDGFAAGILCAVLIRDMGFVQWVERNPKIITCVTAGLVA